MDVAIEEIINISRQQLNKIAAKRPQIEQNTTQYHILQQQCLKLSMNTGIIITCKPYINICSTTNNFTHLFESRVYYLR
jgi:hypothetical protein